MEYEGEGGGGRGGGVFFKKPQCGHSLSLVESVPAFKQSLNNHTSLMINKTILR